MAVTEERITMTMREVKSEICCKYSPNRLMRYGLRTARQIRRLVIRFRGHEPAGLVSKLRSAPSNRRLNADLATRVAAIIRDRYTALAPC